jgi:hypothetical protein
MVIYYSSISTSEKSHETRLSPIFLPRRTGPAVEMAECYLYGNLQLITATAHLITVKQPELFGELLKKLSSDSLRRRDI